MAAAGRFQGFGVVRWCEANGCVKVPSVWGRRIPCGEKDKNRERRRCWGGET